MISVASLTVVFFSRPPDRSWPCQRRAAFHLQRRSKARRCFWGWPNPHHPWPLLFAPWSSFPLRCAADTATDWRPRRGTRARQELMPNDTDRDMVAPRSAPGQQFCQPIGSTSGAIEDAIRASQRAAFRADRPSPRPQITFCGGGGYLGRRPKPISPSCRHFGEAADHGSLSQVAESASHLWPCGSDRYFADAAP